MGEQHRFELIEADLTNDWDIYSKKGMLYDGYVETWREYAVFHGWILGYDADNIATTPSCIQCDRPLSIHRTKNGKTVNMGRRFHNCNECYFSFVDADQRCASFLWADGGASSSKVSALFLQ